MQESMISGIIDLESVTLSELGSLSVLRPVLSYVGADGDDVARFQSSY